MIRALALTLSLIAGTAVAQTTLDITVPGPSVCSYVTGAVTSGSTAGHLQATATSSSGAGCGIGSGNVTFGPASPLSPQSTTLPTNTGTVNFSFLPLNATSCTGSINPSTGIATASFTGGSALCGGSTGISCASPVSAVATFDNENTAANQTYGVSVTCTGPSGQATSLASVIAQAKGQTQQGSCLTIASTTSGIPNFTRWDKTVTLDYFGTSHSVDTKSFTSAYLGAWPGQFGLTALFPLPVANYMSLAFTVPPNFFGSAGAPPSVYGDYTLGSSGYSTLLSMTISTTCGDFSDPTSPSSTVLANCRKTIHSNQALIWHDNDSSSCVLHNGQTYFLNLINADVSLVLPNGAGSAASYKDRDLSNCSQSNCNNGLQNGPGSFGDWSGTAW